MYEENTIRELIENNLMYSLLSDKLDVRNTDRDKTFAQVCKEKKLNSDFFGKIISTYDDTQNFPFAELQNCCLNELLGYLKLSHKFYLQRKLPEIELTAMQVFRKFSDVHPLLSYLCVFFSEYKEQLTGHILYEEKVLFPYIDNLLRIDCSGTKPEEILSVLNQFSTREFITNHSDVEEELQSVRKAILNYTSSTGWPLPFRMLLRQLYYFEIELNKHALIEDEILIPKVIELEAHLLKKAAKHSLGKSHFA